MSIKFYLLTYYYQLFIYIEQIIYYLNNYTQFRLYCFLIYLQCSNIISSHFLCDAYFFSFLHDKGKQSWTASHSDNNQYFIFDLDHIMRINHISTQGRPLHDDFVSEYTLSYGSNGLDYADLKTSSGNVQVRLRRP